MRLDLARFGGISPHHRGAIVDAFSATTILHGSPREVLLKRFRVPPGPAYESAFLQAAALSTSLAGPGIASPVDHGLTDAGPVLVVPRIHGRSATALARDASASGRPMEAAIAAAIVGDAMLRLGEASRGSAYHASISPSALVVTDEGQVVLTEGGMWSVGGADELGARLSSGLASLVPPERFAGHGPSVAGDVFAFGATLHWLLENRLDPGLASFCATAMAQDPQVRYPSLAHAHQALLAAFPMPASREAIRSWLAALAAHGPGSATAADFSVPPTWIRSTPPTASPVLAKPASSPPRAPSSKPLRTQIMSPSSGIPAPVPSTPPPRPSSPPRSSPPGSASSRKLPPILPGSITFDATHPSPPPPGSALLAAPGGASVSPSVAPRAPSSRPAPAATMVLPLDQAPSTPRPHPVRPEAGPAFVAASASSPPRASNAPAPMPYLAAPASNVPGPAPFMMAAASNAPAPVPFVAAPGPVAFVAEPARASIAPVPYPAEPLAAPPVRASIPAPAVASTPAIAEVSATTGAYALPREAPVEAPRRPPITKKHKKMPTLVIAKERSLVAPFVIGFAVGLAGSIAWALLG